MQEFAGQRPFCKRTCKRDAAESVEQEETGKMQGEASTTSCRDGQGCERQARTPETDVVWLITQRSQVQILPPLPSSCRSGA
jgi:hypothetical protein